MISEPPNVQEQTDIQHLKLLSIFHYVVAGVAALIACIPFLHLAMGIFVIVAPQKMGAQGEQAPAFMGWFLIGVAAFFILAGWIFAILVLIAGRSIARRKHYTFCFVMACVECIFMPFGTILGAFTIIVLIRQSVKHLFVPKPTW